MSQNVAHLITAAGILLFIDGNQYTVANDNPNFRAIKDAIGRKDYAAIPALVDIRTAVRQWMSTGKDFALVHDRIELNGDPFSETITNKVLNMIDAGNDADPLFKFLRKVRENPSKAAQDELLLFCVANGFMIHADGDIIAYKSVRGNFTDIHSGKFNNRVGQVNTMARHTVDDDRNRTCSSGLHFASHEYASTWAGAIDGVERRLMVLKINPRDVVSIPNDYDNQKGRCARYEVIAELKGDPLPKREVYEPSDFVDGQCTFPDCNCEDDDLSALEDRIDELQMEFDDLENTFDELQDDINEIEDLGGNADGPRMTAEDVENQMKDLERQIEELQREYDERA